METVLFLTVLVVATTLNCACATPINVTIAEDDFAYCTANVTLCRVTITELYDATDDALNVFDELCTETDLTCDPLTQYTVETETNRTLRNDIINGELEKLIGRLKTLDELCEDEEDKLFNGEESLTDMCNVLKCSIEPIAHKVAQFLLDEKCGCSEGCYYVAGKYVPYDGTKDLTHLFNVLHDAVNFLEIFLSDILMTGECGPATGEEASESEANSTG